MKKVVLGAFVALFAVSCNQDKIDALTQQVDSLQQVNDMNEQKMNSYFALITEVQSNLRNIKQTELGILDEAQGSEGVNSDSKQKIQQDFESIHRAFQDSRTKLDSMENALKKAEGKLPYLRGLVAGLQKDLKASEKTIKDLKAQLDEKNIKIASLDSTVASIAAMRDSINEVNNANMAAIQQQDEELNTAYYFLANKKTLKEKGLKNLQGATINESLCTKVDIREFKELPLGAKKAVILTNHPTNSYSLVKSPGDDKNLILKITNYKTFWSVSKKLVIQVK
jgi:chromosome segregation ATPase